MTLPEQAQAVQGFRLSPQQQSLVRIAGTETAGPFLVAGEIGIRGPLDPAALQRALRRLVARHEILRTTFRGLPGMALPLQVIGEEAVLDFEAADVEETPPEEAVRRPRALAAGADGPRFELGRGPVLRARLIRLGAAEHRLLLELPAMCADGSTLRGVARELAEAYGGTPADPEPTQYADVAEWLHEVLESPEAQEGRRFWRARPWRDAGSVRLPVGRDAGPGHDFAPAELDLPLAPGTGAELAELCAGTAASPRAVLAAAFSAFLARLAEAPVFPVGVSHDGRRIEELAAVIGPLARDLPLRLEAVESVSFSDLAAAAEEGLREAARWQECFTWELAEELGGQEAVSAFRVEVDEADPELPAAGGLVFSHGRRSACTGRFRLGLAAWGEGGALRCTLRYDAALYGEDEARRLAGWLGTFLAHALRRPGVAVGTLPLSPAPERHRLLVELAGPDRDFGPPRTLTELVEARVQADPDAPAMRARGSEWSYGELAAEAHRLACRLRAAGVRHESRVALCVERSPAMVIGILAILEAGGAYVPLDPAYPHDRLELMLRDSGAKVLVAQEALLPGRPAFDGAVVVLGDDGEAPGPAAAPWAPATPDDLAYAIYTSGSTGRPKGVMVSHRAIVNRLLWMRDAFPLGPADRVLQKTPFSFDASIWEIFVPLLSGALLVVADPGDHRDVGALAATIEAERITVLQLVPSALAHFLDQDGIERRCATLRHLFCGGEALPGPLADRAARTLGVVVSNLYGPTETAIDATCEPDAVSAGLAAVPIGRPLDNVRVRILDARGRLAPQGLPGELHVGGVALARGYLGGPARTAERFVPDPWGARGGERLYKTGDRARWLPDGRLAFLGRVDQQVKLRGVRVEPGEVEAVLREHPGVRDAVVVVRETPAGENALAAYVVAGASAAAGRELHRLPNGLAVAFVNRDEADVVYREVFEAASYMRHGVELRPGAVVFDVGANVGMFALFVQDRSPGSRVYAFEPIPEVFETLRANVELYGLDAVLFPCGVSDREGEARFVYYPQWSSMSGAYADPREEERVTHAVLENRGAALAAESDDLLTGRFAGREVSCAVRTLSSLLRETGVDRVDLLKIDVEKSELDVLAGLAEADWPKIAQVVVEVHDLDGRVARVRDLLERHGFGVTVEQDSELAGTGIFNLYAVRATGGGAEPRAPGGSGLLRRGGPVSEEGLRELLASRLPEAMLPRTIDLLPDLPRLPNGKVDRSALPAPGASEAAFEAPRTETEAVVAGVWAEVLGHERVSRRGDFFDLGGHSLLATQVMSRLRRIFRVDLSLRVLFEARTVAALSAAVDAAYAKGAAAEAPRIPRSAGPGPHPLSFAQQRLWFLDRLAPGTPAFNLATAVRWRGPLDLRALAATAAELVRRHESLRTTFRDKRGHAYQEIGPPWHPRVPLVDLSALPQRPRERQARRQSAREERVPFDLRTGPLLRLTVLRLAAEEHVLLFTLHHVVSDAWSMGVLAREVAALYPAFAAGRPSPLDELEIQYADFARWQRDRLRGEVVEEQLAFWRERLRAAPRLPELPTDHPRPEVANHRGRTLPFHLSPELTGGLSALSRRQGASLFMTLLATFEVLLGRFTGSRDVVVGTDVANRHHLQTEGLIGFFVNQVVLRADLVGDRSFLDLLARVRDDTLDAFAHQDLPFEMLLDELGVERDLRHDPLFQVKFFFVNTPARPMRLPGVTLTPEPLESAVAKLDLTVALWETDGRIGGWVNYRTDLFETQTIERLMEHYRALLEAVAADPEATITELERIVTQMQEGERAMDRDARRRAGFSSFKTIQPAVVSLAEDDLVTFGALREGEPFPGLARPASPDVDLARWAAGHREAVEGELLAHGAILFRGFGIDDPAALEGFAGTLCDELFNENGEHPRESVTGNVYTPVFYPPDQTLLWHNENSFNHRWPKRIFFACATPPERGGETPVVDSRRVYRELPAAVRERFEGKGVMYVRNYGTGLGLDWQTVFQTDDPAEVEARCRESRTELEWLDGGRRLRTRAVRPAVIEHPDTGEASWFNQAQHWHTSCLDEATRASMESIFAEEDLPRQCYLGDGTPIADDAMAAILDVYRRLEVAFPWQRGDVIFVDNLLVAHGRNPFSGPRKILVALGDMTSFDEV